MVNLERSLQNCINENYHFNQKYQQLVAETERIKKQLVAGRKKEDENAMLKNEKTTNLARINELNTLTEKLKDDNNDL